MNYLTISDFALIIDDIVENKWDILTRFAMGTFYGPAIQRFRGDLNDTVEILKRRPLSE